MLDEWDLLFNLHNGIDWFQLNKDLIPATWTEPQTTQGTRRSFDGITLFPMDKKEPFHSQ